MVTLKLSKLDAAKRQIETAIRIYFGYGDPVSIHTLTAAAYNIVRDINVHRGGKKLFMKDGFLEYVVPGREAEVRKYLNAAENFFKHADRDHNDTIDFQPESSDWLLWEAGNVYSRLTGEVPALIRIFHVWFLIQNPTFLKLDELGNV